MPEPPELGPVPLFAPTPVPARKPSRTPLLVGGVAVGLIGIAAVALLLLNRPQAQVAEPAESVVTPPAAEPLVAGAAFLVSGRGEVTVVPLTDAPSDPITVGYQVADADGRTSRSTLTVTVAR